MKELICTGMVEHEFKIIKDKIQDGIKPPKRCYICKRPEGADFVYFGSEKGSDAITAKTDFGFIVRTAPGGIKLKYLVCRDCVSLLNLIDV